MKKVALILKNDEGKQFAEILKRRHPEVKTIISVNAEHWAGASFNETEAFNRFFIRNKDLKVVSLVKSMPEYFKASEINVEDLKRMYQERISPLDI